MKKIKIALVGQPNVGKSMLINSISHSKLRVGNFSGVTVEKAEVSFEHDDHSIRIIDLPGTYSLNDYTQDERVTKEFLKQEEYDLIINVVDSTNLERNLFLTTQLLELNKKVIVALNMIDEADAEGVCIDAEQLSKILGATCIKVSAVTKQGIEELVKSVIEVSDQVSEGSKVIYSDTVEEEIENLVQFLEAKKIQYPGFNYRHIAVRLLQEDKKLYKKLHDEPVWIELLPLLRQAHEHLYLHYNSQNVSDIFDEERAAFAKGAMMESWKCELGEKRTLTEKIDSILIHKFFGIPIFLFLMWTLFQLTFELGSVPMDWIDAFFVSIGEYSKTIFGDGELGSMIADGAIAGVGAVVLFLPNIMILFLGIALLETTGYMSRVAFLLDGFFHRFGLHGKSFIPLVTGFGCSVPAYMSARTLKNDKDRLITLFIIGFMSCGAKLPVYVLFAGAFFSEEQAGNVLFGIYILGVLLGLISAKILKIYVFKGNDEPFVMEMPKYRMPSWKLIWHTVITKSIMYLKKAGTFILAASLLIWFASNYPKNFDLQELYEEKINIAQNETQKIALSNELNKKLLEQSYLGMVGKITQPLFDPLGFDWRMTVALETGLAAKEVVISTLGVLYSLGEDVNEETQSLKKMIQAQIPFASAISFVLFFMVYMPCFAASIVFAKEAGSNKYLLYLFLFTSVAAWSIAFVGYRLALLFT